MSYSRAHELQQTSQVKEIATLPVLEIRMAMTRRTTSHLLRTSFAMWGRRELGVTAATPLSRSTTEPRKSILIPCYQGARTEIGGHLNGANVFEPRVQLQRLRISFEERLSIWPQMPSIVLVAQNILGQGNGKAARMFVVETCCCVCNHLVLAIVWICWRFPSLGRLRRMSPT